MEKEWPKAISCPFCGAPCDKLVPSSGMLKCSYCGGSFQAPPRRDIEVSPCYNHPDRFPKGLCNDCSNNFCEDCLHTFDLRSRDASATLYLCSGCLRIRKVQQAKGSFYAGILMVLVGLLFLFSAPSTFPRTLALLPIIFGIGLLIYGYSKGREADAEYDKSIVSEPQPGALW